MTSPRYTFDEVKRALHGHWGLGLHRGGEWGDGDRRHDGRWAVEYSKTGFVVSGQMPRGEYGFRRYETLGHVVAVWELATVIKQERHAAKEA